MTDKQIDSSGHWSDQEVHEAFTTISHQLEQSRVKYARIVSQPGFTPKEINAVWETFDAAHRRKYFATRGLVSKRRHYMTMTSETRNDWKYQTFFMSNDSKLCGFVSESLELQHKRDVIQIESVEEHLALITVHLDEDYHHGPVIITEPNCHFKFSPQNGRKFLYFAEPIDWQRRTKNRKNRQFVIGIYDMATKGVTVITDENVCEETINAIEWTPDSRGIVFHRENDLFWYRFGEKYVNKIYSGIPTPLRITFAPDDSRLVVFLPASDMTKKSILLFHWPFVKAAAQIQHDVVSLDGYNVWSVPDRPWANGGESLMFNVNWQHQVLIFSLRIDTLTISKINFGRPALVVDVQEDEFLFETIAANAYSRLWISSISAGPEKKKEHPVSYLMGKRPDNDNMYNFNVTPVFFDENQYSGVLYMIPDSYYPGKRWPLVVVPYGGDKPNFTLISIDPLLSTLVNCGFCVLIINYREPFVSVRGSDMPNFSFDMVTDDVHNAVVKTLNDHAARLDEDCVCFYGYKYGSMVAYNVILKNPDFYSCAAFVHPLIEHEPVCELVKNPEVKTTEECGKFYCKYSTNTPCLMVMGKFDDHEMRQFKYALLQDDVACFDDFEEEDEQYSDFIVKIVHFFKFPAGELVFSSGDEEEEEEEVGQEPLEPIEMQAIGEGVPEEKAPEEKNEETTAEK